MMYDRLGCGLAQGSPEAHGVVATMAAMTCLIIFFRLFHCNRTGMSRTVRFGWAAIILACGFTACNSSAAALGWAVPQEWEWGLSRFLIFAAIIFHTVTCGPRLAGSCGPLLSRSCS